MAIILTIVIVLLISTNQHICVGIDIPPKVVGWMFLLTTMDTQLTNLLVVVSGAQTNLLLLMG